MDFMIANDLLLECIRAAVLIALLAVLFLRGNYTSLSRHPGWKAILVGFCLITIATLLDITDEIPGLERFVVIGDTPYEAFLEKMPGYLLGFICVLVGFYRMIPSLLKAEQNEHTLQESEKRLRQLFRSNPDPLILVKSDNRNIFDVNRAFEDMTGYERHAVIDKKLSELSFWQSPEGKKDFYGQLDQFKKIDNFETQLLLQNQSVRDVLLSARTLKFAGEAFALIGLRDISRIKEAEKALIEIDQMRQEFISTAAHELRTPLSVLLGYSELLSDPEVAGQLSSERRQEALAMIREKGLVLAQIIDDLLDINRIQAGMKFGIHFEMVNPNLLLKKAFEEFKLKASKRKIICQLPQAEDLRLTCDGQRIIQVIENLLSNAVKYSPEEGVVKLAGADHPDSYEISVSDDGIGMTPEQSKRIFDKFYRVDSSNTAVGGLGLGMNIVKEIVDAHGGTITIDSSLGKGTCVKVSLPKK
jgi:PAS domain S-box-containing protein